MADVEAGPLAQIVAAASALNAQIAAVAEHTGQAITSWKSMPLHRRRRLALTLPMIGERPGEWNPTDPPTPTSRTTRAVLARLVAFLLSPAPDAHPGHEVRPQARVATSPGLLASILVAAPGAPAAAV